MLHERMKGLPATLLAGLLTTLTAGCGVPDNGPTMRPGEDCLSCHSAGGEAAHKPWSAAGTVFRAADSHADEGVMGATVLLTDARGRRLELVTNASGNFYTAEALELPYRVEVHWQGRTLAMPEEVTSGSCALCHTQTGLGGASGRVRVP